MTNQPTYNQPPMQGQGMAPQGPMTPPPGGMMPPQMPPMHNRPAPRGRRERWMHRFGMDTKAVSFGERELTLPNWVTGKSIVFFFVALFACWGVFGHVPEFDLWIVAAISVILFFYGGSAMSKSWSHAGEKRFLRNVFLAGFLIRLLWVLYCYIFFNPAHFATTFGDSADVEWYMPFGEAISQWIRNGFDGSFDQLRLSWGSAIDDVGYPMWLGIGYAIWGEWSDVFMPFVVKCVIGAYCAISIYHVAKRHFGDGVARIAAIFICVNPNMIYWCASMMKEAEMVFLVCLAVDNFDRVLSSGKRYTFKALLPGILAGLALMFFRMALGLVFFLAVLAHVVMASNRVMTIGKKVLAGMLVVAVLGVSIGDRFLDQSKDLLEKARSDDQKENMEWRGQRVDEGGRKQSFAKYAGAAVFAPLIFTIPFPTFNEANVAQLVQVQLSGGSYIKNVFSFFVILVMIMMLISGEWRRHVFIIAYTIGYLIVLTFSGYAQSGRYHMPVWPMLMLFAAYGVQIAKGNAKLRRGFTWVLVAEIVVCLAWNWFKLKGRGMI